MVSGIQMVDSLGRLGAQSIYLWAFIRECLDLDIDFVIQ